MAKKKTKNKAQENPLKVEAKRKCDYLLRLKMISDHLVGPGWFEFIPQHNLDIIYDKRQ